MIRRLIVVLVAVLWVCEGYGQSTLYRTKHFTLQADRVIQGNAVARALSDSALLSTYRSPFWIRTKRVVEFKFSINGFDNERVPGQDHFVVLPADGGTAEPAPFVFGDAEPAAAGAGHPALADSCLNRDCTLRLRVDMRKVLREFGAKGYYETPTGQKIRAEEFRSVYVAGGTLPLSWDFASLVSRRESRCTDEDKDSIYEVTVHIPVEQSTEPLKDGARRWTRSADLSLYPELRTHLPIVNALYNNALEEMQLNVRPDGAFMAGTMWPGVWTRDLSYSIILSLAIVNPDASKASLLAKVRDGRIIQDTGTGGSWPVSSDRMVWAIAAWELYKVTGDREWLQQSYGIIKRSVEQDLHVVYDPATGLFNGESSFLDWREQTYPRWMEPKDIYASKCLGTNAVHYKALRILAAMADILGEPSAQYAALAEGIRKGVNEQLWLRDKGYYGQYLYGRLYTSVSPRSEALGEALAVLYNIADSARARTIIRSTPTQWSGIPCIYPNIPNIPPYHNNAVWPFVEAFWGWASARVGNSASVERALATIYRPAALFGTNKENMVASTGDYMGTEINSSRQLWSVAGNLASVYRIFFGMEFSADSLTFVPFVPKAYKGEMTLRGVRYHGATLDLVLRGFGSAVKLATIDELPMSRVVVPGSLKGRHSIVMTMNGKIPPSSATELPGVFSPATPVVSNHDGKLRWDPVTGAVKYMIFKNGKRLAGISGSSYDVPDSPSCAEYQVEALDSGGRASFLSEPIVLMPSKRILVVQAEQPEGACEEQYAGFTGRGYIRLQADAQQHVVIPVHVETPGLYAIDFRYANGSGPVNTDNKCALRTLRIDQNAAGTVVFPQRGAEAWTDWGYSSSIRLSLQRGDHSIALDFSSLDGNMNGSINTALLDCVRMTLMGETVPH